MTGVMQSEDLAQIGAAPDEDDMPDLRAWLARDVDRLVELADRYASDDPSDDNRRAVADAAHDLKGLALTYGFPVLSRVCRTLETLCRRETGTRVLPSLIQLHALACLACVKEGYTGETAQPILSAVLVGLENARLALD